MSKASSPTHFNGETDHFYDPTFTAEVSAKMQVPKRIRLDGDNDVHLPAGDLPPNTFDLGLEKIDMSVPDRILVRGNDEHIGVRAPPREMLFDNAVFPPPPDYSSMRLQTPPRVLTLDEHYYPSLDDPPEQPPLLNAAMPRNPDLTNFHSNRFALYNDPTHTEVLNSSKEMVPALNESMSMTPAEEIVHLRRQLAKLNRRVMSLEIEIMQKQQRDRILYGLALGYFLFKTVLWLSRSH